MENTYRDVNIAIANEFARLADRFGVDVWEAIALANRHPRVNILQPGPGCGWALYQRRPLVPGGGRPRSHPAHPHRPPGQRCPAALRVDTGSPCPGRTLQGCRIAALGLAYKPDVDDLRESPAVEVVRLLTAAGAEVLACEPYKPDPQLPGVVAAPTLEAALQGADAGSAARGPRSSQIAGSRSGGCAHAQVQRHRHCGRLVSRCLAGGWF